MFGRSPAPRIPELSRRRHGFCVVAWSGLAQRPLLGMFWKAEALCSDAVPEQDSGEGGKETIWDISAFHMSDCSIC